MMDDLKTRLQAKLEELRTVKKNAIAETGHKLGESCAPGADLTGQCEVTPAAAAYYAKVAPVSAEVDALLLEGIRRLEDPADADLKVPRAQAWVWGGPTPFWFGSLAADTLLVGADYFQVRNVVYVGGPVTEEFIAPLAKYDQVMVQMTDTCRAEEFQPETDEECAEKISRFSVKYPNIVAGIMDDATRTGHNDDQTLSGEVFSPIFAAIRRHNPAMKVAAVIYAHELDAFDFTPILPYLGTIVLWFWGKNELLDLDERVAKCRQIFPGKELLMGVFIHDYGCADLGNPPECLRFQMRRAARLIRNGTLNGIVILGDREIRKWPQGAQAVRDCLD